MNSNSNIIINADDFGKNEKVNAAVIHCLDNTLCSSATIMANMPGFEEACQAAYEHNLIIRIGIHVVLSEGKPLTDAIRREARFCDENGFFRPRSKHKRFFKLSTAENMAVSAEVSAQIEKCCKSGLLLTHLDSHHHFHEEWGIMNAILPVIRQYHIPCVRVMRNICVSCTIHRKVYAACFNAKLRILGLAQTRFFGSIYNYIEYSKRVPSAVRRGTFEIMVHPDLNANGKVIDAERGDSLDLLIAAAKL